MTLNHFEILWILGSLAVGFGLFIAVPIAVAPAAKRPLVMAALGFVIICVSCALSGLIYRDQDAYEQTRNTSRPQGLEWAGIDHWAYYAGYQIGAAVLAVAVLWWIAGRCRSRRVQLASVTQLPPEQPFQAAS